MFVASNNFVIKAAHCRHNARALQVRNCELCVGIQA